MRSLHQVSVLRLTPSSSQLQDGEREHLGRVDEIVDAAPLVGLMREIENARPVGHAVRECRRCDRRACDRRCRGSPLWPPPAQHARDAALERGDERRAVRRAHRVHDHQIAQHRSASPASRAAARSSSATISAFVASNPSSSRKRRSNTARQRSATHGVWMPSTGWPPAMPLMLSVACRARGGHDRHRGRARRPARGRSSRRNAIEDDAHVLDRADAEKRHAAVRDAARASRPRTSRRRDGRCRCDRR